MGQSLTELEPPPHGSGPPNPAEPDEVPFMRPRPKRRLPPGPYAKTSVEEHSVAKAAGPRPLPKPPPPAAPPAAKAGPVAKASGAATACGGTTAKAPPAMAKGPSASSTAKATPVLVKVSQSEGYAGLFCYVEGWHFCFRFDGL